MKEKITSKTKIESKAQEYISLKSRIKAEVLRRKYTGSVSSYGGSDYDYTVTPKVGDFVKAEHYNKLNEPLRAVNPTTLLENVVSGDRIRDIAPLDALTTILEGKSLTASSSNTGCNASCTGLCSTTCTGSCSTSCSGTCSTNCTGCSGTCSGGCSGCSGCGGSCSRNCTGCSGTCSGSCSGCSGCGGNCTGVCRDGCTSGCTGSCAGGCKTTCGDGCTNSCRQVAKS